MHQRETDVCVSSLSGITSPLVGPVNPTIEVADSPGHPWSAGYPGVSGKFEKGFVLNSRPLYTQKRANAQNPEGKKLSILTKYRDQTTIAFVARKCWAKCCGDYCDDITGVLVQWNVQDKGAETNHLLTLNRLTFQIGAMGASLLQVASASGMPGSGSVLWSATDVEEDRECSH